MKKSLFIIVLIFSLFLFPRLASAMEFRAPTHACYTKDGVETCGSATATDFWGVNIYRNPGYFIWGSSSPVPNSFNFFWQNYGLCANMDILLKGRVIASDNTTFDRQGLSILMGGNSCSYRKVNGRELEFTCTGRGGGDVWLGFYFQFYTPGLATEFGVSREIDVSCSVSNADSIANDNRNTQSIIDNNNQNTNRIVESQNETKNAVDEAKKSIDKVDESINDDNVDGAIDEASGFFDNFTTDTFGLTSIITAPLETIKSLTSTTCESLELTVPFVNKKFFLPCMSTIYKKYFGNFLTIYQVITFGLVSYWVCVRIFNLVKDFKNPDHDEVEVLDL